MKQIVIISGKGGTGKTIITGAFSALAQNHVVADCDVDASDMYLLLEPEIKESHVFKSGATAYKDKSKCIKCGICKQVCRFDAFKKDGSIDPLLCEGCGFCSYACPENAIEMQENETGHWFISNTRFATLVHAKLGIGEENSGKLVSLVREKAKIEAQKNQKDLIIIDGAPGIGCPLISCITGVDLAIVVTEPTQSGLADAKRVIEVARHFKVSVNLIINKYDLNLELTKKIEDFCQSSQIPLLGKIPFDKNVIKAMVQGKTIIEYQSNKTTNSIRSIWNNIIH